MYEKKIENHGEEPVMYLLNFRMHFGSFQSVVASILARMKAGKATVVVPCSLNDFASSFRSDKVQAAYESVDICTADGFPLVLYGLYKGHTRTERVYGPNLAKAIFQRTEGKKYRHVFLCSSTASALRFQSYLSNQFPALNAVGFIISPHLDTLVTDWKAIGQKIKRIHPSVVWIGLSSPKQVLLAIKMKPYFPGTTFFCVGAAIELLSGGKRVAPEWMQSIGLEWLFRLISEPARLWRRYLVDIPFFLLRVAAKRLLSIILSE